MLRTRCVISICLLGAAGLYPPGPGNALASSGPRAALSDSVYNLYVGNLHSHTSYSDGVGTPAEAFAYGRDSANVDFLAVTDHHQMLTTQEYDDILYQAHLFTENGVYIAIAGQEWTGVDGNHSTVWCADHILTTPQGKYYKLYDELFGLGLTAAFCHPLPRNWGFFEYSDTGDVCINTVEVRNLQEEERYIDILGKGWHVGTDGSQDNHGPNWGKGRSWTVALACSLTTEEIVEASRNHRTYSTLDRDLQMIFKAEGHYMGDEFAHADHIRFSIDVLDADAGDDFTRLELFQNGAVMAWLDLDTTACTWEPALTPPDGYNYYFVKAYQRDYDLAWSAPVWIDCTTQLPATPKPEWPYDGQIVGTVLPDFSWRSSEGAYTYTLYVSDSPGFPAGPHTFTVAGIPDTFYTFADSLHDDVTYFWKVQASNQHGESEPSSLFEFLTDADASSVPGSGSGPPAAIGHLGTSPNPFTAATTIEFSIQRAQYVDLTVYDVNGRSVKTLFAGNAAAGLHSAIWNGCDSRDRRVSPGVYIFKLEAGGHHVTWKAARLE